EGGDGGGRVVAVGTPEEVAKNKESWTGKFLAETFRRQDERRASTKRAKPDPKPKSKPTSKRKASPKRKKASA
ncbi:MAG: hypothetical protein AAF767_05140, partial [Pseudomonadota bacterium]